MATNFHAIAQDALALDPADRLRLAAELIDSVDDPADAGWDDAWLKELEARRAQGAAETVPWSEVRARALRRLSER